MNKIEKEIALYKGFFKSRGFYVLKESEFHYDFDEATLQANEKILRESTHNSDLIGFLKQHGYKIIRKDLVNIHEMALPWIEILFYLLDQWSPMILNLQKLFLYPDYVGYLDLWKKSLWEGFEKIEKVKNPKTIKFPSKRRIYNTLWTNSCDILHGVYNGNLSDIIYEHKDFPKRRGNYPKFEKIVRTYADWLSKELSLNGGVKLEAVSKKVDELFGF